MNRHFTTTATILADRCVLGKDEARHLATVLRVKPGDHVQLFDGHGCTRVMKVSGKAGHGLELEPLESPCLQPKPVCALTLFVCISKGKRMDWTVEKAVELGVSRIVPVVSDRTIVRLDPGEGRAKVERWTRLAEEAARQSSAVWLPEIVEPVTFRETLASVRAEAPVFVGALTPDARPFKEAIAEHPSPERAGWYVGPEGDFTPEEMDALLSEGAVPVTLGKQILRAETACIYGLCVLGCAYL